MATEFEDDRYREMDRREDIGTRPHGQCPMCHGSGQVGKTVPNPPTDGTAIGWYETCPTCNGTWAVADAVTARKCDAGAFCEGCSVCGADVPTCSRCGQFLDEKTGCPGCHIGTCVGCGKWVLAFDVPTIGDDREVEGQKIQGVAICEWEPKEKECGL